jgi:hypothetical protein
MKVRNANLKSFSQDYKPTSLVYSVMRPNNKNSLEISDVTKSVMGPQNMHEGNSVEDSQAMIGPRHSMRARKQHSMWKEFVKK